MPAATLRGTTGIKVGSIEEGMGKREYNWCAHCQFDELEPFMVGTVVSESSFEAERLLRELIAEIFPQQPNILELCPGYMQFIPEE